MKTCIVCNQKKEIESFAWKQKNKGLRQSMCTPCRREYAKTHYKNNERSRTIAVSTAIRNNAIKRDRLKEYKQTLSCTACNENESVCLDFHHLDPTKKDFVISNSTNKSWKLIMEEISKCVVLCSNCHRKVHAGIIRLNASITASATNGE